MTTLSQILTNFVSTLSPEQRLLFKDLCNEWAHAHYEFGEVFKMQYIELIPPKINSQNNLGIMPERKEESTICSYCFVGDCRLCQKSAGIICECSHPSSTFTPQTKKKGDPLQELLSSMSDDKKKEIQEKLQKIVNTGETK